MSHLPFHCTKLGHRFFENTLPELIRQIARLNDNLEKLSELLEPCERPAPADEQP